MFGGRAASDGRPIDTIAVASIACLATTLLLGYRVDTMPAALVLAPVVIAVVVMSARTGSFEGLIPILRWRWVAGLAVLQFLCWQALVVVEYFSVDFNLMDTGSFAHVVANLAEGRGFTNHLFGGSAWADHFSPNLALAVPLHKIWPSFLWLPILKVVAYFSCLPILWRITGRYRLPAWARGTVLLMWLTNYPLARTLGFEFQPSSLALPFVLLAFCAWLEERRWLSVASLLFVLGFKEHMALVWVCFGAWLIVDRRDSRRGIVFMVLGVVIGCLIVFVLTPALAQGQANQHLWRFGPFDLIGPKILFLLALLVPVGLIPLLEPRTLLFWIPASAITLVSGRPKMVLLHYHYQDLPGTILFMAVIIGLARMARGEGWIHKIRPRARTSIICFGLLLLLTSNHFFPSRLIRSRWPSAHDKQVVKDLTVLREHLDPTQVVFAQDSLGPYLFDHAALRFIDSIDTPFAGTDPRQVVLDGGVNPWPLTTSQVQAFEARLEAMAEKGEASRIGEPSVVSAYRIHARVTEGQKEPPRSPG